MSNHAPILSGLGSDSRRRLLKWAAASGLLAAVGRHAELARAATDYKALVCIYLNGGNDGENTLIRFDAAGYQNYASIRTPSSGVNIPQAQLLPIQPARGGPPFGFHPACAPLQQLFNQRQLAVLANVGPLFRPVKKAEIENQSAPRPANLFSHNDQLLAQQSADCTGLTRLGWGGRIADRLDGVNAGTLFPAMTSVNGLNPFINGVTSVPLTIPANPSFSLNGSGTNLPQFDALRDAAIREMLAQRRSNVYDLEAQLFSQEGIAASSVVTPILQNRASIVAPYFANLSSYFASQLRNVALMIEGRAYTGLSRQVFYVGQGGYDTHGSQASMHASLLTELAQAVKAFQDAVNALGIAGSVTSFTLSDFGRALKPAGNSGTDHGWGNYAFVMGGAVKGGDFYGTLPTMALDGPDDFGKEGRWIPTTSLEQYGATLARWFGVPESDLPYVFPNIGAFANTNLGFMT